MNSKRIHSSHKEIYKIAVKLSNEVYTDNGIDLAKNMSVFFKALNNVQKSSVELRRFEQKDFRLLACRHNNTLFLSIRGSGPAMNWIKNADCFEGVHFGRGLGKVHPGFKTHFKLGLPFMKTAIDWVSDKVDHLIFCGHSLGGAIAELSYYHFNQIEKIKNKSMDCVTFGAPRIGCGTFCRDWKNLVKNSQITLNGRFVNTDANLKDDLVTTIPPWCEHPIDYQRIKETYGKVIVENKQKRMTLVKLIQSNADMHSMDRYEDLVNRYLNQIN